jgi:16S rRNA (guanine527-N7)-methyltransferase
MLPPLTESEFAAKTNVSRETLRKFRSYADLLVRWQASINLVSENTLKDIWRRHFWDSVQLARFIPKRPCVITDLGSGAGFPGLVLSIFLDIEVNLVDSSGKKVAFLREAARVTDANIVLHQGRIEDLVLPKSDLITARALAPLEKLVDLAMPVLSPGGKCLFLKGARAEEELTNAKKKWNMTARRFPSATNANGVILSIQDIARDG